MIVPGGLRLNKLWVPLICLNTHASFLRLAAQVHWQPGTKWQIFQDQEETAFQGHCCCLVSKSCLTLVTPWTIAHQAPLSMGFARRDYWSGLPFPSQEIFPAQGLNPCLPHWQSLQRCAQYLIDPRLVSPKRINCWTLAGDQNLVLPSWKGSREADTFLRGATTASATVLTWWVDFAFLGDPGFGVSQVLGHEDMGTWGMGHGEHIIF